MLIITDQQKERFKNIVNRKFSEVIKFINISLIKSRPDLIDFLLLNDISFNILADVNATYDTVPIGWGSNGCYKNGQTIYCNPNIGCINIGFIIDNKLDILYQCINLKMRLGQFVYSTGIPLVIGDNVNIINNTRDDDEVFKKVTDQYLVDAMFKYFKELFV